MKLIVLSDLHLTTPGEAIIGIAPWARLEQALDHAQAQHPDAARYVLLGDVTHDAPPGSYERLAARLADLPVPVTMVPGNHDDRAALRAAFPDHPVCAGGFLQSLIDTPTHRLVFLDTLAERPEPRHAGILCPARLDWFARALDGANGRAVVVFMHHPPLAVGFPGMDRIGVANAEDFWALARGRVAHLVLGHIHRTISGAWQGTGFTVLKSITHQSPMKMDSTSSALSVAEPGAYGIVLLRPGGVVVHSDDFTLSDTGPVHSDPRSL